MRYILGGIVAALAVAAFGVAIAANRGDTAETQLPPQAVRVADRFMQALVLNRNAGGVRRLPHISLSIGVVQDDAYTWAAFLDREGIDTIERGSEVQEDCEVPFPIFAPEERMTVDCVVYQVRGRTENGRIGVGVITARMRVWVAFRRGAWRVVELDFAPRNGFRSVSKAFYVEGY